MNRYCRAYRLGEMRAFAGWEQRATGVADLGDDEVVYLRADLTVVRTPVLTDPQPVWEAVDSSWRQFCTDRLRFAVPADTGPSRT